MFSITIFLCVRNNISDHYDGFNISSNIFFYTSDNTLIDNTSALHDYSNSDTIYTILPDDLDNHQSLCFQAKHLYFSAYVEDELIYEQFYYEHPLYTYTTGTDWYIIPLDAERHAGKKLFINYRLAYEGHRGGMSNVDICNSTDYILNVMRSKLIAVTTCLAYVVIGLLLIALNIIVFRQVKHDTTLLWLGFLALYVAVYCFLETHILQLFVVDKRLVHLWIMFAMILIPTPAVMYSDSLFKFKHRAIAPAFAVISFVNFIVQLILTVSGVADYHDNIMALQFLVLSAIFILTFGIVRYIIRYFREGRVVNIHIKLMIIGLACIMVTGIIDITRYWFDPNNMDSARFIRFGFLGFIFCFAVASSESLIDAFKVSMKTKMIAKLAYEDGLTGLYNRTSYQEMLERIQTERINTGIVMMDLNNLKFVNDTFGHDDGDDMLIAAAEIIKKSFNKHGMTHYRIGGDEFVVLVQTDNIRADSLDCIKTLEETYREFNANTMGRFKVVIAVGFDAYTADATVSLDDIVRSADAMMYSNKKELKKHSYLNVMV